jgi:hypothetical protein
MGNSTGNGHGRVPLEILDRNYPEIIDLPAPRTRARRRPIWPAIVFLCLTFLMTLSAGALIATSFAANAEPFSGNESLFAIPLLPFQHPGLLLLGIPFSLTLLGFFMELIAAIRFSCLRLFRLARLARSYSFGRPLRRGGRFLILASRGRFLDFLWRCR